MFGNKWIFLLFIGIAKGIWLSNKNLITLGQKEFPSEQPQEMRPLQLRVAVEEWIPHVKLEVFENGTFSISGPMAKLLDALAQYCNFKYTLVRPPDGAWGAPDSNGRWNGMIGMVKRNEADIALGPFGLTETRAQVVSFSQPIMIDYYRILVKRGQPETNPWGFLNPLSPGVWLGMSLSFGGACLGYTLAGILVGEGRKEGMKEQMRKRDIFFSSVWDQYAVLMQQTLMILPEGLSSRMMVGLWIMIVMVIMRSYSGALTSLLAVRNIPVKINSLKDLMAAKEYKMVFEASTALTTYMSKAESGIYAEMNQANKEGRSEFKKPFELFVAAYTVVRTKKYALLVEETTVKKVLSDHFSLTGKCDYFMAKETYFPLIFCMIGQHGFHLMPFINYAIQALVEHDLYSTWLGEELNNMTACIRAPTSITVTEPYNITGLWGVFMLLTGGLLMAVGMFLGEVFIYRTQCISYRLHISVEKPSLVRLPTPRLVISRRTARF